MDVTQTVSDRRQAPALTDSNRGRAVDAQRRLLEVGEASRFALVENTDKVKPPAPSLPATGKTLFLIVPTKTQPCEDDIENRIWESALAFAPSELLEKEIESSRTTILARFRESPLRRKPWHRRSPLEVSTPVFQPDEAKDPHHRVSGIIKHHTALLEKAVCQLEVIEIAPHVDSVVDFAGQVEGKLRRPELTLADR